MVVLSDFYDKLRVNSVKYVSDIVFGVAAEVIR